MEDETSERGRSRKGGKCVLGGMGADVSHIHIQTSRKLDPPPTIRSRDREGLVGLLLGCINRLRHTNNDRLCQASINIFPRPLQNQQWSYRQRPKQKCSNREVILMIYDCLLKTQMLVLVEGVNQCLHKNDQFQSELCAIQNLTESAFQIPEFEFKVTNRIQIWNLSWSRIKIIKKILYNWVKCYFKLERKQH